ncbi:sensor histidine kinase [Neorhodopirellula pilleata]|uniref:sensor histidine kinase n=1 Tax=Neorhodopirellula pilleata TaxID=2714738 RepID=UPI001E46360B|nr:ATP-binding protein [Neorhodopirellula pilleata]
MIHVCSVGVMLALIAASVHWLASNYFMALVQQYHIDAEETHRMFLKAVDHYLLLAGTAGFLVASVMNSWLNARLVAPIGRLVESASRVAQGDFRHSTEVKGCAEIDDLCVAFNRMADDLQSAESRRREFISDVAHELRTPLTNIRGFLEGLHDQVFDPDPQIFASLLEETMRLVRLVDELFQLTRAESIQDLNPEVVDLNELIASVLLRFEPRFDSMGIALSTESDSQCQVFADRSRLTQVLTNLLDNTLHYTPRNGRIRIRVIQRDRIRRVAIENDCDNPPPPALPLFERFQRAEKSRSREYGGAGLGLAIVRELIRAHDGSVGYQTDEKRATFWFELPELNSIKH